MFISPMLLHRIEQPFDSFDYLTELKLDGIRLIHSNFDQIRLYTRHNNDVTGRFPEVLFDLPKGTILDGELILAGPNGAPDFERLMDRFMVTNPKRIAHLSQAQPVTYCAFDVLRYQGQDLTKLPLYERKGVLDTLPEKPNFVKVQYIEGNGISFFDAVQKQDLEGMVLKKKNSTYQAGVRSHSWLKVINYSYIDAWITGYRKSEFGWLLAFENGAPAGVMELGVPFKVKAELFSLAKSIKSNETRDYVYFEPGLLRCKVKYRNLTRNGLLRSPSFVSMIS